MIKKRYKSNSKCLKLCAMFLFPFALFGGISLATGNKVACASESYIRYYNEKVNLTNSNFEQGATPFTKGDSLAGWNAIEKDSHATGMLIDVGRGTNTDDSTETTTFSNNKDDYMLVTNPGAHGKDSRIMMINSKEKLKQKNVRSFLGYRSSSITLEANSNYVFSVSAKAMLNEDDFAQGSIYLSGLTDKDGEEIKLGYENFSNNTWKEFYFFVSTGNSSQTVTLDLYLGTNGGSISEGAVFFDNVSITRYSQNQFMELSQDYGYNNKDNKFIKFSASQDWDENLDTVFLIDELKPNYYLHESANMNFDFEDETNGNVLGDHWQIIAGARSNANAQILDVRDTSQKDFEILTGHDYLGDDFSYNNTKALVLWTTSSDYSSDGYVGVKSEDIKLEPHSVYKVSLKMKVSGTLQKGSFTLKVKENDYIYSAYPTIISSDSDKKNYYALQTGSTSGITGNVTNAWANDYQTVELYIKSHSMFSTSVNLELWLGDSSNRAEGCVAIDNIQIERSAYSSFSGASNQHEFKWNESSEEDESFKNSKFNKTENDNDEGKFPVKATDWTATKENDKLNESGVLYLADKEAYDNLYKDKGYVWAGINPNKTKNPNNVYMMFNRKDSYQSLLSSASTIEANSYYKLSFDYYNQLFSNLTASSIKVEVIDENGIVLFSKSDIQCLDDWASMDIYLHTAETVSHSIQVKVSLGDEDNKVGGIVYLDNFTLSSSENFKEAFKTAENKSDLTNYYLNLEGKPFSGIKESPAYKFTVDEVYDANFTTENCGNFGGLAYGKDNNYEIVNDNNLLVISNRVASSTTLKTAFNISMNADSFYELSFDLATYFDEKPGTTDKDHKKCKYGFKVTVDGYEAISEIVGDDELQHYKIYYKTSSESSTPKISFTLVSDCDNSLGTAIISNLDFTSSDEATYTNLPNQPGYEKTLFKSTQAKQTETPDDGDSDNDNNNENESPSASSTWILIPSIIMGVALIIAILGMIFKKIKIKKIDRIKKETYDRKISVNHDIIMAEAQKKRDGEVKDLQVAKSRLVQERETLEQEHKEYVKEQRTSSDGKISKSVENEFKKYNSNISRLDEKINILNEKIENCMTADYLLSIERKLVMEEDERLTAERRERKALAKEMKKANKGKK